MWPILACSVVSITIILERYYCFYHARTRFPNIVSRVKALLRDGKASEVLKLCEKTPDPIAHILAVGIHVRDRSPEEKERLISRAGSKIIRQLDKHLRGLAVIVNASTLLGLLGTVTGMIKAFMKIQELGGRVDASVLAGGIWEALLATVAGLVVAIPAFLAYNYLVNRIHNVILEMERVSTEFVNFLSE